MIKKKIILCSMLGLSLFSTVAEASWWGQLKGGERAAIIAGTILLAKSKYDNSEAKHREEMKELETKIRREYEAKAVAENAVQKYENAGVPEYIVKANPNKPVQNDVVVIEKPVLEEILRQTKQNEVITKTNDNKKVEVKREPTYLKLNDGRTLIINYY